MPGQVQARARGVPRAKSGAVTMLAESSAAVFPSTGGGCHVQHIKDEGPAAGARQAASVGVRSRSQSLQALATQAAGELESGEGRSLLIGEHQDVAPAGGRVRPAEEAAPTPCALPRRPGLGRLGGLRTATRVVGHAASLASVRRGILRGLRFQMVPPAGIEPATHGLGNRCSIH